MAVGDVVHRDVLLQEVLTRNKIQLHTVVEDTRW